MSIEEVLGRISQYILNPVIVLLFTIAFFIFVYGIFQFIAKAADDKTRADSKRAITYGLVGMFVMISAFAIIRLILSSFGLDVNVYPLSNPS